MIKCLVLITLNFCFWIIWALVDRSKWRRAHIHMDKYRDGTLELTTPIEKTKGKKL